jgi:phosphoribosyl 1,2-cyclic phosphate phosphodiesterase
MNTVTFLGTGTSQGIPLINCTCRVCLSDNPKNKRLRSSITIETPSAILLIDTTPDLRQQLLRNPVPRIDAILYTHAHADHIYGMDDIRRFNFIQKKEIPAYANQKTLRRLNQVFGYAFKSENMKYGFPMLEAHEVTGPFFVNGTEILPVPLMHGENPVLGFRIGNFAYCTDVNRIPDDGYEILKGIDVLVLDALREISHPTHYSLDEAISEAQKIGNQETYFIHMSHEIDHDRHGKKQPGNMHFAYDGLQLETD